MAMWTLQLSYSADKGQHISPSCGLSAKQVIVASSLMHNHVERFSYDLETKTRKQNRNSKRTERERFDWFIERIQTRVVFDW